MKGATAVIALVLMFLVAIGAAGMFFSYLNGLQSDVVASGEKQMVELSIPPKLMSLICYTGYGYLDLSLSQGQKTVVGQALYSVDLDTGKRVAEGFVDMNITGTGKVYIPYFFDKNEKYLVTLSGKKWKISEYCRPFDDPHMVVDLKFDDGSGVTATDSSEYKNDGVITSGSWVNGKFNGALTLDGSASKVVVSNSQTIQNYTSFTISLWFKYFGRGPETKLYHTLFNKNPTGSGFNDPFHAWVLNSTGELQSRVGNGSSDYQLNSGKFVNDGLFHQVVLTYDNSQKDYILYMDGAYTTNKTVSSNWLLAQNTGNLELGIWSAYANFFNGTFDEFRMYTRAFTDEEVLTLYNSYEGLK